MTWRAPRGNDALQVWAEAFGGHTTSPLYKKLVVEDKKAVQTGVFYDPVSEAESAVTYYAIPAPGVTIAEMEQAMREIFDQYLESGLDQADIDSAKQRLVDASIFERDSLMGPAMVLGRALTSGMSIDYVENWPDRIEAITADDIGKATAEVFKGEDKPVRAYLLPEETQE